MDTQSRCVISYHWRDGGPLNLQSEYNQRLQELVRMIAVQGFDPRMDYMVDASSQSFGSMMENLILSSALAVVVLDDAYLGRENCQHELELILACHLPVQVVLADKFGMTANSLPHDNPLFSRLRERMKLHNVDFTLLSDPSTLQLLTSSRLVGFDRAFGDVWETKCDGADHAFLIAAALPAVSPLMYVFRTDTNTLYAKETSRTDGFNKQDSAIMHMPFVTILADLAGDSFRDWTCYSIHDARRCLNHVRRQHGPNYWAFYDPSRTHVWIKEIESCSKAQSSAFVFVLA